MNHVLSRPENYVNLIQDKQIRLENVTTDIAPELRNLGASRQTSDETAVWIVSYDNEIQLATLLGAFRDLGFLFVGGPAGWPPAEVFEYLRKQALLSGKFQELIWYGPQRWHVRSR